jgi:hypothetical protein
MRKVHRLNHHHVCISWGWGCRAATQIQHSCFLPLAALHTGRACEVERLLGGIASSVGRTSTSVSSSSNCRRMLNMGCVNLHMLLWAGLLLLRLLLLLLFQVRRSTALLG